MLLAKGNEDIYPHAQGFESYVLKSNGMASGHPFLTKSNPDVSQVSSLQQSELNS